jgi:hypothetical protein
MTLMGVKPSTKDVDFMVPNDREYAYLIKHLQALGYRLATGSGWKRVGEDFQFDLFRGNRIHTTELLKSPLAEGGILSFGSFLIYILGSSTIMI